MAFRPGLIESLGAIIELAWITGSRNPGLEHEKIPEVERSFMQI